MNAVFCKNVDISNEVSQIDCKVNGIKSLSFTSKINFTLCSFLSFMFLTKRLSCVIPLFSLQYFALVRNIAKLHFYD